MERRAKILTKETATIEEILFPDAIFTADWHLREDAPECRDPKEFREAQIRKLLFLIELQSKYSCPIYIAGDVFDYWKPSLEFLSELLDILLLDMELYTIYGNHDLPQHNIKLAKKCGIHLLSKAKKIKILPGTHWLQQEHQTIQIGGRKVLIQHIMTYQGKKLYPGMKDTPAAGLLRKYPKYDVIVTGHNHQAFVEEYEGRILVNPGSITRQDITQAEFRPRVYLYSAKSNKVQPIYLPIDKMAVRKSENTEVKEQRNARIEAFIQKLDSGWDSTINFEENLERFFAANEIKTSVRHIIAEALEEIKK